ncbi:uncharacterized protein LOC110855922 [Folsomia candida]|uniref:Riboflavin biosynthesis protein PYRR, chloroplastic n=1 Tax=Folsomia candida TaxID=158441 RepID=A0A226DNL3_FOLCA|nr:uncharacterized protein LOC110855922 [Folsomia candida]OXA46823.1 Riboflavin biosynthesis protein PYRR, chloroplastic [Folsomia candida]
MATTPEKFTFFYHAESPFSQFHYAKFTAAPINFHNAEEELEVQEFSSCEMWMMYNKAKLFKDEDIATKILNTEEPFKCKKLGRQVKKFDQAIWNMHSRTIVKEGNRHKFTQNPALLEKLRATKGTTLAEASPRDLLYGIGLSANNPRASDRNKWRGRNVLGQILTDLRDELDK